MAAPTPDELRARIEEAISKAMEAHARGDEAERGRLMREVDFLRVVLETVEATLSKRKQSARNTAVRIDDSYDPRLAKSAAKSPDDAFTRARLRHNYTQEELAQAIDWSNSSLSLARKGERSIPQAKADKIAELIGFPATKKNWPGGIV